jgi:enoyl-CoA hydratase/carnithine racemase
VSEELIDLSVDNGVATLRLNRPAKRNAFDDALRLAFIEALESIHADETIRALVLAANGKAFCAGGDVSAMLSRLDMPVGEVGYRGWKRQHRVHHAQSLLQNLPVPTVAAVHGDAAGLGADVALACDFVVLGDSATLMWSYIKRGLVADGGGMYSLPRRVGLAKAKELIFTGRTVASDEALALGLADRVVPAGEVAAAAQAWADELSQGSRVALGLGKSILNASLESTAEHIAGMGAEAQGLCYSSTYHRESVQAFVAARDAAKAATDGVAKAATDAAAKGGAN